MSDTIPPAILDNIARVVAIIRAWNAGIVLPRDTYAPTRRRRERVEQALQTLEMFETRARALGIPIEALYAACGGKPVLDPDAPVPPHASARDGRGKPAAPGTAPEAPP